MAVMQGHRLPYGKRAKGGDPEPTQCDTPLIKLIVYLNSASVRAVSTENIDMFAKMTF